jgi:hypothetical protein
MSAALEVIKAIEANGGRVTVEGDCLVIVPRRAGIPLLPQLQEHKPEILALLQQRARDPETWRARFVTWLLESCELRKGCKDSQSVASLLIDFAEWCAAHDADAPCREMFERLLSDSGLPLKNGLAVGIALKVDLEAAFQ